MLKMYRIENLFNPKSVALIGATEQEGTIGRQLMKNLLLGKDIRNVYAVNPNRETILRNNPKPGEIAFISQSGALGTAILDWAVSTHVGFSMFASLGSMLNIDFGDLIESLWKQTYPIPINKSIYYFYPFSR